MTWWRILLPVRTDGNRSRWPGLRGLGWAGCRLMPWSIVMTQRWRWVCSRGRWRNGGGGRLHGKPYGVSGMRFDVAVWQGWSNTRDGYISTPEIEVIDAPDAFTAVERVMRSCGLRFAGHVAAAA